MAIDDTDCAADLQADIDKLLAERQGWLDEIERLRVIVKTAANNLDSLGAHHYASWCRLSLEQKAGDK